MASGRWPLPPAEKGEHLRRLRINVPLRETQRPARARLEILAPEGAKLELMTVSRTARRLGVSVDWLGKAKRQGRIPHAKRQMCGWRVYSEEDIGNLQRLLVP